MNTTKLTDSQRSLMATCLRIAAGAFSKDLEVLRTVDGTETPNQLDNFKVLEEQFQRQYSEALSLAESIDNADEVSVIVDSTERQVTS